MADVMQETSGDEGIGSTGGPGMGCALQGVIELGDVFVVVVSSPGGEEVQDLVDGAEGHRMIVPSKSPMSEIRPAPSASVANSAIFCS